MKESVHYKIATPEDASSLPELYRYTERCGLENPTDALSKQLKKPEDSGYWFVANWFVPNGKGGLLMDKQLAGFLDGDGCIGIYRCRKKRSRSWHYVLNCVFDIKSCLFNIARWMLLKNFFVLSNKKRLYF